MLTGGARPVVGWFGRTRILQHTALNGSSTLKAVVDRALFAPSGGRQMAEDDSSSLSPNAAIRAGKHHYKMRPNSEARRTAIRRFATPSLMFMRWKRELIELLLT